MTQVSAGKSFLWVTSRFSFHERYSNLVIGSITRNLNIKMNIVIFVFTFSSSCDGLAWFIQIRVSTTFLIFPSFFFNCLLLYVGLVRVWSSGRGVCSGVLVPFLGPPRHPQDLYWDGDRVEADRDGGLEWIPDPVDGGLPPFTELNSLAQGLGICISGKSRQWHSLFEMRSLADWQNLWLAVEQSQVQS